MKDYLLLIKKLKKNFLLCKKFLNDFHARDFKKYYLYLPPLALFFLLANLILVNTTLKKQIENNKLSNPSFTNLVFAPYPVKSGDVLGVKSSNNFSISKSEPDISAKAAVIMDDQSKVVLFSKNAYLRFSMASTTKIMTALTALDFYNMNDILTIKTGNVKGAVVGFKKGEKLSFKDLLYAMLLPSGNDAAIAIAQNYPGGESAFIEKMNDKAQAFNLIHTHFSDSAGLEDEGDYTTVLDLARLSSIVMKNLVLAKVVATQRSVISNIEGTKLYEIHNLNKLLGIDGVRGIKTGFTDEAGGVLTTAKMENGHLFIIVVMKSQDRFDDTEKLLSLISGKITYVNASSLFSNQAK